MNKNIIQFIVDENGQYISIPVGRVKAKSNLTTRIQLVTPITASTAVNYLIYDSKNINKKQYLIPTGELGSAVVDPNNPNYQLVAGWKVYEADIYAPILSVISKYRTGKVGMSFEFVEQVPNALCTNFVDYFGFNKELPETAEVGEYYICEDYNFWLNDKLYNKGDILVWYGEKWNDGGILPKALTETVDISVDPAISYPTEEVEETAFGNAIGELAEDVSELDTRLNGVETNLNGKQDKVDLLLDTASKTVVGGINEVKTQEEAHYNTLNANKLDKNFNLLVERTFSQLTDWVAVRSGSDTLKMSLETLRTYLTQGLVGLSFVLVDELPPTGVLGVIYLTPFVENIEHIATVEDLPIVGELETIYIIDLDNSRYQWNGEEYEAYNQGYEEWVWLEELDKYELIGTTKIDLSGYATETWVTDNFTIKSEFGELVESLNGGTTGQILTKKSDSDLDVEWVDKPTAPIQEIQVDGVEVPAVDGVVNIPAPSVSLNGVDMLLDSDKTYLVIKTPADNDTFTLLTDTTGSPNYIIEWGDGTSESVTTTANPTHEYAKAGMYLITISGSFTNGIVYGQSANANKNKIIEVYGGSNYPTSISNYAFYGCTSLTTAYFPSVTSITRYAFESCTSLTTVHFPKATSISNYAFRGCSSLTTVHLPSVTSIGTNAFLGCTSLTTVHLPSVTSVGGLAFESCTSLTTVHFPKATSISDYAFRSCTSLTTAYFPLVTSIGNYAFRGCTSLTTAYFPNATSISGSAFNSCTSLKELTIGNVTTTSTGTRFTSVVLDKLTISGNISDTDINRIKQFYADNGGTFSNSYEIKHGLQIEKTPTLDNDVVRKIDLDAISVSANNVAYDNATSGLTATNVQDALDELQSEKIDKTDITTTISGTPSDTMVASESAVASALTSASGLTLSDNLDSPSSAVGLSTEGANLIAVTGESGYASTYAPDLNVITKSGFYTADKFTLGIPKIDLNITNKHFVIHIATSSGDFSQIFLTNPGNLNTTISNMWVRYRCAGEPAYWTSWIPKDDLSTMPYGVSVIGDGTETMVTASQLSDYGIATDFFKIGIRYTITPTSSGLSFSNYIESTMASMDITTSNIVDLSSSDDYATTKRYNVRFFYHNGDIKVQFIILKGSATDELEIKEVTFKHIHQIY